MSTNKRKFDRFDLPLIVKFRPTYGATDYTLGLTKNFSYEGLGLESRDFNFIPNENLELNLKFPQSGTFVSLLGDVMWKRESGDKCLAGVKLKVKDEDVQNQIMGKISSYGNISLKDILKSKGVEQSEKKAKEKPVSETRKQTNEVSSKPGKSEFIKQYLKNGSKCKVIFRLPKDAAPDAKHVTIVGDFNGWDTSKSPMTRLKNGDFQVTLELKSKREYKFRYLIEGERWENDWSADRYDPNSYGSDDSVVIV